jgi:ribosomal-protein-alanine N-acetyltransferase
LRLLFERPRAEDLDVLAALHADPRVMATLGGVRSREQTQEFLTQLLAHWEEHGFGLWVVRERSTRRFAGRGGLRRVSICGADEVEVAYALVPELWGRGLATEIARESIRVAFEALGLPDLVSFTLEGNLASRRVMEKAGFRYERDFLRAGAPHVLYRLDAGARRTEVARE